MTTYELPPEPPIGESVKDKHGRVWKHIGVNNWTANPDSVLIADSRPWLTLLASSPLTLIEPDPWLTARTVAASVDGGAPQLLVVQDDYTAMTMTGALCRRDRNTLSNVVPVTVVPVAEWRMVRDAAYIRRSRESDRDYWARVGKQAVYAVTATDALGVDL